jgi:large subunit ribosomal protein L3
MPVLYGTKVGMTRVYDGDTIVPVTVIECIPNEVVQVKTVKADGFDAVKVAVGGKKKNLSKPVAGEYKKAGVEARLFLREVPVASLGKEEAKAGAKITVSILDGAKLVNVTGQNKGRGFAGVMKRHNFSGHKATHGTMGHRVPGAIGCRMDPGRTFKGQRMAGHWGNEQVTIKNLKIVSVDAEKNLVVLKGAIPGPNGGLIAITQN